MGIKSDIFTYILKDIFTYILNINLYKNYNYYKKYNYNKLIIIINFFYV